MNHYATILYILIKKFTKNYYHQWTCKVQVYTILNAYFSTPSNLYLVSSHIGLLKSQTNLSYKH